MLTATHDWVRLFQGETAADLMRALPEILQARRWFGGKARRIEGVHLMDSIAIPSDPTSRLLLIKVEYGDSEAEIYSLPVSAALGQEADRIHRESAPAILTPFVLERGTKKETGLLYDALWNRDFSLALLHAVFEESKFPGMAGSLTASSTTALPDLMPRGTNPEPVVMGSEQSNTSVAYDGHVILKLYRRVEEGTNLDLEVGRVLTQMRFPYIPSIGGALEYRHEAGSLLTLGVVQQFVVNDGTAWQYSLEAVKQFIDRIPSEQLFDEPPSAVTTRLLDRAREQYSPLARHLLGESLEWAERLGQRTAQLHRALSQVADPAFVPEPLSLQYRQTQYQAIEHGMTGAFRLLKDRMPFLSTGGQEQVRTLFALTPTIERIFHPFLNIESSVPRIRCHGDYHLGQVLCTGTDFMIIDFEGEPARSLVERRRKHPVLLDIAGMIRSFHYASFASFKGQGLQPARWASFWSGWASVAFLKGYLTAATGSEFWPDKSDYLHLLLDFYLIEKALYELRYELNNRPDWAEIPLYGLTEILQMSAG